MKKFLSHGSRLTAHGSRLTAHGSRLIFVLTVSLYMAPIFSQTSLFSVQNPNSIALTMDEQAQKTKLLQSGLVSQLWHVQVNSIGSFFYNGVLHLTLPDLTTPIEFTPDAVSSDEAGGFYWGGYNMDGSGIQIASTPSGYYGSISIASTGSQYQLVSLSPTKMVLTKGQGTTSIGNECGNGGNEPNGEDEDEEVTDRSSCQFNVIRVLFLFTNLAAATGENPAAIAQTAVNQMNAVAMASGLSLTQISYQLAGTELLSGFTETFMGITADVSTLLNNTTAQSRRDANFADVVVLLTNGDYGQVFGSVAEGGICAPSNFAYCIAQITHAALAGEFTAAHEVAHLIGARHQRCGNCDAGGCDSNNKPYHGFLLGSNATISSGTFFKTLMAQIACNGTRIARVSNPDVQFMGMPTGNSNNNNSKIFNKRAAKVACFKGSPPVVNNDPPGQSAFPVSFFGPATVANCIGNYQYTANVPSYGIAFPVNYEWQISSDGITGWTSVGYNSTFVLTNPTVLTNPFFLKLTVVDANQKVGFTQQMITKTACLEGGGSDRNGTLSSNDNDHLFFYPNPAGDEIYLTARCSGSAIKLKDLTGKVLKVFSFSETKNTVQLAGYQSGLYLLSIESQYETFTQKLIKL